MLPTYEESFLDFFAMQWHAIDFAKHQFWHFDPVGSYYDPNTADMKWKIIETSYIAADRLVATLLKHATPETLVAVVSDHGHLPGVQEFLINNILIKQGMVTLKTRVNERGRRRPSGNRTSPRPRPSPSTAGPSKST